MSRATDESDKSKKLDEYVDSIKDEDTGKPEGRVAESCAPPPARWEIKVFVTSEEDSWPESEFRIGVIYNDGSGDFKPQTMTALSSSQVAISGSGAKQGDATTSGLESWNLVETKPVALPADNKKIFELKIKLKPWIKFRVRRHDRDEVVAGIRLALKLPGEQTQSPTTEAETILIPDLAAEETCEIEKLTADDGVWIVVDDV